jgi:hypothetical protein
MALHASGLTESVGREEELLYREIARAIASPDVKKMEAIGYEPACRAAR